MNVPTIPNKEGGGVYLHKVLYLMNRGTRTPQPAFGRLVRVRPTLANPSNVASFPALALLRDELQQAKKMKKKKKKKKWTSTLKKATGVIYSLLLVPLLLKSRRSLLAPLQLIKLRRDQSPRLPLLVRCLDLSLGVPLRKVFLRSEVSLSFPYNLCPCINTFPSSSLVASSE
jgi:hypothetical protein